MKLHTITLLAFTALSFAACKKKDQPQPEIPATKHPLMTYHNLADKTISFGQSATIDLDGNGKADFVFYTEQVSYDLNTKVKNTYQVASMVNSKLAVNTDTETTPHYTKGTSITVSNLSGYEWFNVLSITLIQQVFTGNATYWEGNWKTSGHEYLPVQVFSGGKWYLGWVELSADVANGRLVLHRAALCTEPETIIKAGI